MHIDVSDILDSDTGANLSLRIEDEHPDLEDVDLAAGVDGEINLVKTDFGLVAHGQIQTQVRLECHRCLRDYAHSVNSVFETEFASAPTDDQWPIAPEGTIDLAPIVRQEVIVQQPIKQVCEPDCPGLCAVCGQRNEAGHQHAQVNSGLTIKDRLRNKKGT